MADKKNITITKTLQKILDKCNRKPNKTWIGSELYNISMKSFLQDNNTEMHWTHNQGKAVVTERVIRTSKNKIYKYMNAILNNVYIDNLHNKVTKYIDAYHRTIKIKAADVTLAIYADFKKENNKKGPKFKIGGNVRISKNKNIFAIGHIPQGMFYVLMRFF